MSSSQCRSTPSMSPRSNAAMASWTISTLSFDIAIAVSAGSEALATPTRAKRSPLIPRLGAEVLVLGHELACDERRPLRVGDDGHSDPGRIERRDHHLSAELPRFRGGGVGI